ncbi:MAG TPA: hypothetical protein PLI95_23185 [Polyangiaceae bacterium]|nr:hypothetical protein [Polyangiaceae bacterium]
MRKLITPFLASLALAIPMLATSPASAADLSSCGNINVSANAQCELVVDVDACKAKCTPISAEMSCSVEAYGSCDGECQATLPSCDVSCNGTCEGSCTGNPGSFDCQANCQGTCEGDCSGKCASDANKSECEASCKATCQGECKASCEATPPSADCKGKCEGSCKGSCNAEARMDCQVDCQGKLMGECKGKIEGGCEVQCSKPDGALFCNGSYVDAGGNLESCMNALEAALNIKVSGHASADCEGNSCSAEAEGSASCGGHVAPVTHNEWPMALGLLGALGIFTAVRRRK